MNRFTLVIALTSVMGFAGCRIYEDGVADVTAAEAILSDRTVQPSNSEGFGAAIRTAASSAVATTCIDENGKTCEDTSWNGNVYQSSTSNISAVYTRTESGKRVVNLIRDDDFYFQFIYEQYELLTDLKNLYGNEYYYFKEVYNDLVFVPDHTADALIQHVPVSDMSGDHFLVAGTWLVQIRDSAGDRMEVVSFALPFANAIEENLGPLTVTVTYGATGDETPEASGYFFANNVLTRFLADAVLTVGFGTATEYGEVSGQISSTSDYPGQDFTLTLEAGTIVNDPNDKSKQDELRGLVFDGDTEGVDGALVDDDWAGKWGGKVYGGDGRTAPEFVYGTFGACDTGGGTTCTAGGGSLIGAFIAPKAP